MPAIVVQMRDGSERTVQAKTDRSLMEGLRDGGIDDILALCGGSLSCATCHVYVDPAFADRLGPMSETEAELLEFSEHRTDASRLSCQIKVTPELDGLRVTVPDED